MRVVRSNGNDRYTLLVSNRELSVRSGFKLPVGGSLRVRAFWNGPDLTFKLDKSVSAIEAGVVESGLQKDETTRIAVRALLYSGMSLGSESIRHIVRTLTRRDRMDPHTARLIALIVDKKIEPTDAFIDALLDLSSNDNSKRENSDGRDTTEGENFENTDGEIEDTFAGTLHDFASPADEERHHALALFNHMKSVHDQWIIVPYKLSRGAWDAKGDIRIRLGRDGSTFSCVVDCETEGEHIEFRLRHSNERGVVALPRRRGNGEATAFAILSEKLQNLGVEFDDINRDTTYDGFTDEGPEGLDSVDTFV